METIRIFSAGVAGKLAEDAARRLEAKDDSYKCEVVWGGSTAGVQRLLSGEDFDVMILADHANIDQMMMPDYADGYFIWGGNEMVVMGEDITAENWQERLLDPTSELRHANPYNDPGGYRAVMALQLADRVSMGLSEKLLRHPNYHGLERRQYENAAHPPFTAEPGVYRIGYRSMPVMQDKPFAPLPAVMNLSVPELEEVYNTATFQVDGGETVRGSVIRHAIVIPKTAPNPSGAAAFAEVFLANRFMRFGFTPIQKAVGSWTIKPPNMWDEEAFSYSLMTLLEAEGTEKQLDCLPLAPDDIVLDCGSGPGRIGACAARRVKKVICLDSSEQMLAECRKNCAAAGVTNVEFLLADWQSEDVEKLLPPVDVIIQSRGGGGPSTLDKLRRVARRFAATIMWSEGAANLPESRQKLFVDCYSKEAQEKYPELRPFKRSAGGPPGGGDGRLFGGLGPVSLADKLPMGGPRLLAALEEAGIEYHVSTVTEGWSKNFPSKQAAYDWLIRMAKRPELVDMAQFQRNVDSFLTETATGWRFHLPSSSDVVWFPTRR
ncbi:MAG: methyltransferase domain-containing protein [Bacillota bacterium]|nr:methyltransferase domain-containing protein [Bacillota bacterium]